MFWNRRSFFRRLVIALGSAGGAQREIATAQTACSPPPRSAGYIRPGTIESIHRKFDLVVVGGGISGTCAAISAARNGLKTALVHERSMLGGNSSSEVRLFPEDTASHSTWIKESGILDEIHVEERVRNQEPYIEGLMNCHWDLVLYEWAVREKNLTLFLNTTMREVEMKDAAHILAVHAAQLGTEKSFALEAPLFVDASGDGVLGFRAGADFRWGKEGRKEYGEPLAPDEPNGHVMGNTLFFRARDTGKPVPFQKPDWAADFNSESDLTSRGHGFIDGGYWWIEVGEPMHPIKDNEEIRHEALRQLLGIWDHIKNKCTTREKAANYALEFVGFWPYKRESRRIIGDYVLTQRDVQDPQVHPDDIAYGCWGIDIHVPGGIQQRYVAPYPPPHDDANWEAYGTIPYGIPLRSCYSRNIHNLLTAGRPISASYVAFASSRVLPTGAIVGQGVGAAAALCKKYDCDPRTVSREHAAKLQQLLLRQGCFIPGIENQDPRNLAWGARLTASADAPLVFPEAKSGHPLKFAAAQLFPVSTDRLEGVELFLISTLPTAVGLTVGLRKAAHVWDFRSARDEATASATVPAGYRGHVRFVFNARTEPGALYYIHVPAQPGISWALFSESENDATKVPVGTTAADLPGAARWRPLTNGKSFVIRLLPEQRPYSAHNVVRGTNRPDRWTNLFLSDSLPAWVELQFQRRVRFNTVEITFDTEVNRRARAALFRYPECVKKYEVTAWTGTGWKTVAGESANYQRRRVHSFDPLQSDRLRIRVHQTNGAKSARIYEVRVYDEA
jgi:FAD-dependent oxidoreductase family protein